MRRYNLVNCALVMLLLSGCASRNIPVNQQDEKKLAKHVVSIDTNGNLKPCDEYDGDEYDMCQNTYFQEIIAGIEKFKQEQTARGKKAELLFFVHGGLNSEDDALDRAQRTYSKIMNDPQNQMYPVFIIWKSGGVSTYKDHLWNIRQGEKKSSAKWTSPIYLLTDIGNSIVNAPKSWLVAGEHLIHSTNKPIKDKTKRIEDQVKDILSDKRRRLYPEIVYNPTDEDRNDSGRIHLFGNPNKSSRSFGWLFTSPAKAVTTPFAYTIAKPAWDVMLRRTDTLFYTPCELQERNADCKKAEEHVQPVIEDSALIMPKWSIPAAHKHVIEFNPGSGALSVFLNELDRWHKTMPVTLVGHSMGAIVVNKIILQKPKLPYKNIVHLASADSVNNVFNVIIPYIDFSIEEKKKGCLMPDKDSSECEKWAQHQAVQFYSLMLHPDNEDREAAWKGLVPSGSLLTWIDEMYTSPQTVLDRRSGRWDNIKKVIKFIPNDVAKNMHFKIFGIKKGECEKGKECQIPQQHGDFDQMRFWDESTWR